MPEQVDSAAPEVLGDGAPEESVEVVDAPEESAELPDEPVGDFDAFVAARGQALLRLALMLTGDPHRAEDLVQSTLTRTYLHWRRVRRADAPEAYVRKVLVRQYVSWRRLRSSGEVVGLPADDAGAEPAAPVVDGADAVSSLASREAAWALLARLPRRQRAVLVLRYYADMSDEQVAKALGCTVGTVRSNASRGLSTLRTVVPGLDEELLP